MVEVTLKTCLLAYLALLSVCVHFTDIIIVTFITSHKGPRATHSVLFVYWSEHLCKLGLKVKRVDIPSRHKGC